MSYIYNLTDTWNAAGTTFAGIKMAVTNTASSAGSNLLDLSVSGATTASFAVNKSGELNLNGTITTGVQQTTRGALILANTAAGAFATTIQSSNSASAAWTLTLPATAGTADYALTTNGSGVSSWSQISLTAGVTGTLPLANGGTNANLTASNGGIVYSGASAFAVLSGTATAGRMLRSGASGAPSWSTATFPSTATSTGTILRADGTNWVATTATYPTTTTANQLLYSSATDTVGGLASANTSALVTNASGVPSFTSGGTANRVLRTDGTTVSFAQVGLTTDVTGVLPVANGGTNASSASITAFNNITGYTASGATGTTSTNLVFSTSPTITTPTFTTSATGPLFIGGTGTTSTLTLRSTSGVGATGANIIFQAGDNGATEIARMLNSGVVYIGTQTEVFNGAYLQVVSAANPALALRNGSATAGLYWYQGPNSSNNYVLLNQGGAGVFINDGNTSWTGTSDERLKNIAGEISDATSKINSLRAVKFAWKSDSTNKLRVGLIAQDVQKVLPEVVSENDGYLGIAYAEMVPLLVAAVKELAGEIASLKSPVAT